MTIAAYGFDSGGEPVLKVCPHCGNLTSEPHWARAAGYGVEVLLWSCERPKPAQPEPAKVECCCGGDQCSICVPQRSQPEPAANGKTRGLYNKFAVARTDGKSAPGEKHDGCEYFVLDLTHDKYAPAALRAYAAACAVEYPKLSADLRGKFPEPAAPVGEMPEAVDFAISCLRNSAKVCARQGFGGVAEEERSAADALESFWHSHAAQPKPAANGDAIADAFSRGYRRATEDAELGKTELSTLEMPWSVWRAISKLREMKLPDCDGVADDLANDFGTHAAQPKVADLYEYIKRELDDLLGSCNAIVALEGVPLNWKFAAEIRDKAKTLAAKVEIADVSRRTGFSPPAAHAWQPSATKPASSSPSSPPRSTSTSASPAAGPGACSPSPPRSGRASTPAGAPASSRGSFQKG